MTIIEDGIPWGITESISSSIFGPPVEAAMITSLVASAMNYLTPATFLTISTTFSGSKGFIM